MRVVLVTPNLSTARWCEPIREALPEHVIIDSRESHNPAEIDIAVVGWIGDHSFAPYANLRLIQSTWMGVDRLLEDSTIDHSIAIARMVDPSMPASMAETVLIHALAAHRQLDVYARYSAAGVWKSHRQKPTSQTTVAILGLGELGQAASVGLISVGFRVIGFSRHGRPVEDVIVSTDLENVLRQADILVNLLPLTDSTRGILCAQTFSKLPLGAVLINVGRGAHLIDEDLISALDSGHLRHAVLDVFNVEPLPTDDPYWTHPRVTVTPHIAAESLPETCLPVIVENIHRMANGNTPLYLVDRSVGY